MRFGHTFECQICKKELLGVYHRYHCDIAGMDLEFFTHSGDCDKKFRDEYVEPFKDVPCVDIINEPIDNRFEILDL